MLKLATFATINYPLLRETLEIINEAEFARNDKMRPKINIRWLSSLNTNAKIKRINFFYFSRCFNYIEDSSVQRRKYFNNKNKSFNYI